MHGGGSGGGGEHGIEGLAPRTGLFTALLALLGFGAAVHYVVKHPKSIAPILIVAAILAGALGDRTVDQSPLIGLIALIAGAVIAARHDKKETK